MTSEAPLGFLGLSHLGVVASTCWASFGAPVVAVDLDRTPVDMLRRGTLPVHEPGLEELFAAARHLMTFSTDPASLAECPLVFVSRDVPTDAGNASDTSVVLALVDAAVPHLRQGVTLVLMSQVPPGFTRRLGERIRASRAALGFGLYYWVETLVIGNAVERYLRPERFIIGCGDPGGGLPSVLASGLARFGCPVLTVRYESAELAKMAVNLYLATSVTYANTLADLCEAVGADWAEIVPGLRSDKRIGPAAYLRPGPGIAGGNLERDMVALRDLCKARSVDGAFIETLLAYNARRPQWVHRKLHEHVFPRATRPVIAVWGLAYKKNTRSTKNSTALRVIRELRGMADVRAYDPAVGAGEVDVPAEIVNDRDRVLAGADCLLILTDWDEFAMPRAEALRTMRHPLILDAVGVVDAARADLDGVGYVRMGRPDA